MTEEKPLAGHSSQALTEDFETAENQGFQEPESEIIGNRGGMAFQQVNAVTFKITDGKGSNAWDGKGGGYRTTRAVAWLIHVGHARWIVRYRDKASRPMKLNAAKKYAREMLKGIRPGQVIADPIRHLNELAARKPPLPRPPTIDLLGGNLRGKLDLETRENILSLEVGATTVMAPKPEPMALAPALPGEDYRLEY